MLPHQQNNTNFLIKPIPFLNHTLVSGSWFCIFLNEKSATIQASLYDADGIVHHTENWSVPIEIVEQWGIDNSIVTNAFLKAKGWNIQ